MPRTTKTGENILDFIKTFRQEKGYSPSVREVAQKCGVKSPSVVQYHLTQLDHAGLITKGKERSRSLGVVGGILDVAKIPLLGIIATGQSLWVPLVDRRTAKAHQMIEIPRRMLHGKKEVYVLQ